MSLETSLMMNFETSDAALQVLMPFSTTYLYESAFATLLAIKTKTRNRLDAATDLRCDLSSNITPSISELVKSNSSKSL